MRNRRKIGVLLMLVMALSIFTACSSNTQNESGNKTTPAPSTDDATAPKAKNAEQTAEAVQFSKDPVTVKVGVPWDEKAFQDRVGNYIKEKLPHITLEYVSYSSNVQYLQELNANKVVLDLILAHPNQQALIEMDMVYGLEELVDKYKIDMSRFDSTLISEIKSRDKDGRLIGLPAEANNFGLHYNKEIFDMFGLSYPTADMTWDEIIDLAQKITTVKDGVQYKGLEFSDNDIRDAVLVPLLQLAPNLTDPETGEVLITKDPKVAKYFELMKKFYSIPGNYIADSAKRSELAFAKKNVAMHVDWHGFLTWWGGDTREETAEIQKNMDILPIPTWSDQPDVGTVPITIPWVINNYSTNKDAAFEVMLALTSDEYQTKLARDGTPTPLVNPEIVKQFGANDIRFNGKNTAAFFQRKPAQPPARKSYFDQYVDIEGNLANFAQSDMNIPEFLRKLKEESEAKIKEAQIQ